MSYDLIVKGGRIVTATDDYRADIAVKGEKITTIAKNIKPNGAKVINAKGKTILPGGIDVHVHLQLPFCGTVSTDDFYTGTRAAARGGLTTIIDYAFQDPKKGLVHSLKARMAEADPKVCVDYSIHGGFTNWNDKVKKEIPAAMEMGIPDFKMFMIYESEGWQSDDAAFFKALEETKKYGAMIMVHAESERVMNYLIDKYRNMKGIPGAYAHTLSRPYYIESEAIQRVVKWTEVTGGKLYVVHMSTGEGADMIKAAREKGINVYAETCPQYLLLDDEVFKDKKKGHWYATCPQLKKKSDNKRLWKGLVDGEVCVISTDTCTFTTKQKAMWKGDIRKIPFGMPGIETLLPSMYTHGVKKRRFNLHRLVEIVSTNPAKMFGMFPKKGTIAVGSDADLAIIDPKKSKKVDYRELDTNCDWNPFQGQRLWGFPDITICRGTVVVDKGKFVGRKGYGKFIPRKPHGSLE